MYRGVRYGRLDVGEVRELVRAEARRWPDAQRVFLADGDVMRRSFGEIRDILLALNGAFSRLARVSLYANGSSIATKSREELRALRSLKLHTLYMGLESGDGDILEKCRKGETAAGMVAAGVAAQEAGLRMSVMVLLGLGGAEGSDRHVRHTAEALNDMQPRLLSALRVIPVPGTELQEDVRGGKFRPLTEWQAVREVRDLLAGLALTSTVFRANHSSNVVPLEGRLPRDRERMVVALDRLLRGEALDRETPGPMPLSL